MQAQANIDTHHADQLLVYVPAVNRSAARLAKPGYDEMRADPNIGGTSKMPERLPLFVGMEVILTESVLPPKYVRGLTGRSHGLPDRSIIESGSPEQISKAFDELFACKIATTKIGCVKARQGLAALRRCRLLPEHETRV